MFGVSVNRDRAASITTVYLQALTFFLLLGIFLQHSYSEGMNVEHFIQNQKELFLSKIVESLTRKSSDGEPLPPAAVRTLAPCTFESEFSR